MDESEAECDLVLIQTFLIYYVNQVILILNCIFQENFHNKAKKICIKTRSPSDSLPSITVKWHISGLKHTLPTPRYGQYLTHANNHITRTVPAMESCFALIGAHQPSGPKTRNEYM